jgi:hypothetical protein
MRRAIPGLAATLVLFAASGASTATICVTPPAITSCPNHTIQAGVNLAGPGDIVKVAPGVYYENVSVGPGKDNLQILGTSKLTTIIDPDVPNAGIGILANGSNGVKISNLTVRNGTSYGIAIVGNGAIVTGVRVLGVRSTTAGGVIVIGNGAQVALNEVRGCGRDGITVEGNSNLIKSNTVAQIPRVGIFVFGDQNQVLANKVSNAGFVTPFYGMYVVPNAVGQNVVASNVLENIGNNSTSAIGLVVVDTEPTVQANKFIWGGTAQLTCSNCNGGKIFLNSMVGSSGPGFVVSSGPVASPAAVLLVQGNKAADTAQFGFQIAGPGGLTQGAGVEVKQNSASESGYNVPCFQATGSGHTFTTNIAQKCGGAGFYSQGDNFLFTSNQALGAATSGFVVNGYNGGNPAHFGVTLNTNKTLSSVGQGFALYDSTNGGFTPVGTMGTGNTGQLNRQDFCNEGAATTIGTFATTSTTCDIRP